MHTPFPHSDVDMICPEPGAAEDGVFPRKCCFGVFSCFSRGLGDSRACIYRWMEETVLRPEEEEG